jgi:HK97 family phage major capsid protein
MSRTAAHVKAEIQELRGKYEALIAKNDPAHDDELRSMDGNLEDLLAEYSQRSQDEQRASSNRQAMEQIFGNFDEKIKPTSDGAKRDEAKNANLSMGARFIQDEQFRAWHASLTPNGQHISENMPVKSPVTSFNTPAPLGAALVTGLSSTSAGALVETQRLPGITPLERDEITILDLVTRIPITTDAFEFVRVTTETNNAAATLEATSSADGAKPESAVAMAVVSGIIETIAHWIPITRRAASDASQIMAYIDAFLRWGLRDALADEVLNGDGTTPNLVGLANTSNTQSQAYSTGLLETTRKARTLVRTVGKATPTAYLMNPTDWESIDLLTDNENRYYFGGPMRMGMPVLWGLPVVEEERQAAGAAWVADWREGLLFDREQTNVYMTDSHSDFFIRNILVILAELRAGFGVRRPKAFVEIDLTA